MSVTLQVTLMMSVFVGTPASVSHSVTDPKSFTECLLCARPFSLSLLNWGAGRGDWGGIIGC